MTSEKWSDHSTLNREIFNHVLHAAKVSDTQQFIFLSGGAGVGKTCVLKSLYRALVKYYNTEAVTVLLTAPTGKAAYLIRGSTLHSTFHIPANQGFTYRNLNHMLNTLRCKFRHLKFLCIDEISMCGANMLQLINARLQEIMGNKTSFGGVHVLCVGDLFQLQPVMDKWVFQVSSIVYSTFSSKCVD